MVGSSSDLARECGCEESSEGVRVVRTEVCGHEILRVHIKSDAASDRIGKPCGRYVTVGFDCTVFEGGAWEALCRVLAVELREMAERLSGKRIDADFSLLVIGLGNADLTPDALGPQTVRSISATRGHKTAERLWGLTQRPCRISALSTGISAQTGLETAEIVQGIVATTSPDLVLVVDALSACDTAHLAATIQLSDAGIQPGGGVGRARPALTAQSVGAPVLALGVPTVVGTQTLVKDALLRVGFEENMPQLAELAESGKSFFVTPKEIDLLLPLLAKLLSDTLKENGYCVNLINRDIERGVKR